MYQNAIYRKNDIKLIREKAKASNQEDAGADIKKKVLRAGCLAQLWPRRSANCLLPGLITSLCYSVNARRKPLSLPRLNSLARTYTHYLNAVSR